MSKKSTVPDAWDDDWGVVADSAALPKDEPTEEKQEKKVSSRASKAQRRAQQAEFNRQLWQEAEGPRETNYYLETRPGAAVPLKADFKPPPILLSRKGPPTQPAKPSSIATGLNNLSVRDESSSDEDASKAQELTAEERKAKAAKDREDRQRKYEERREQLFGAVSGTSSPGDVTPPGSRSGTPSRGRGGRGRGANSSSNNNNRNHSSGRKDRDGAAGATMQKRELFDPTYSPKPDSIYLQRKEKGLEKTNAPGEVTPVRSPRNPDGSGRGGFGFAARGAKVS